MIEKSKYIGYLWYSNAQEPKVLMGEEFENELDPKKNPFIVEGQLCSEELAKSYSIRFTDRGYQVNVFNLEGKDLTGSDEYELVKYESNRIEGKSLKFLRHWVSKTDENCLDMQTRVPAELIFVGFDK